MRLHEDKNLFQQAVAAAARYHKIEPAIIEKDYYVTLFLESLSSKLPNLLFKGGTSLAKCHKIIHRFSEDIDLTLVQEHVTQGQKKQVKQMIKDVCSDLGLSLLNEADTRSRRDYNQYKIDYSPEIPAIAIKPILLVETTFIVKSYPSETKEASSLIYDYMVSANQQIFAEQYGLKPFSVLVQTLDRTLVDKIFALCDYYLTNSIPTHSRHIYDINKLLSVIPLNDEFVSLFRKVREDRKMGNSQCVSAKDEYSITKILQDIVDSAAYKDDYVNITEQVLYETVPYDEAITGIQKLIDSSLLG